MNNQPSNLKPLVTKLSVLIVVVIVGIVSRNLILGGPVIKLAPATPLYGQVSQILIDGTSVNKVLTVSNYILLNPKYFDNGDWATAQFIPQKGGGDNATVVMQKVGPFYQVVLGPGVAFPSNLKIGLPNDVTHYLTTKGLFL